MSAAVAKVHREPQAIRTMEGRHDLEAGEAVSGIRFYAQRSCATMTKLKGWEAARRARASAAALHTRHLNIRT